MKLTFLLPIAFLLYSVACQSQKTFTYFFDKDLNAAPKEKAVFTGEGIRENGLIKVRTTLIATGQTVMIGHYSDSLLTTAQGLEQIFFLNGVKESEGNYLNNKEHGTWLKWDSTGLLMDSTIYDLGKKIMVARYQYRKNKKLLSYELDDIIANTLVKFEYNDSGRIEQEIRFKGQTGIVKNLKAGLEKIDTVYTREEIEANFPGGESAWSRYIQSVLQKNGDIIIKDNKSGTCRVKFVIDTTGNVTDINVITMQGSVLANVVVKALKRAPKWNPAIQYGRRVRAFREQPVTFTLLPSDR